MWGWLVFWLLVGWSFICCVFLCVIFLWVEIFPSVVRRDKRLLSSCKKNKFIILFIQLLWKTVRRSIWDEEFKGGNHSAVIVTIRFVEGLFWTTRKRKILLPKKIQSIGEIIAQILLEKLLHPCNTYDEFNLIESAMESTLYANLYCWGRIFEVCCKPFARKQDFNISVHFCLTNRKVMICHMENSFSISLLLKRER